MELEIVRIVLSNEVNQITVCRNMKTDADDYYTVIAISDTAIKKFVATNIAVEGLFGNNANYIGAFTHQDTYNIVFNYFDEQLLTNKEAVYCENFSDRKDLVQSFLLACIETGLMQSVGALLIENINVNILPTKKIYFNYFLDFSKINIKMDGKSYYKKISLFIYDILSAEYRAKFEDDITRYPNELRLLLKKINLNSFDSFSSILTFVKTLPTKPAIQAVGFKKLIRKFKTMTGFFRKHSLTVFLLLVVLVTIVFATIQIYMRVATNKAIEEKTNYVGIDYIGEVYLGDMDV